MRIMESNPRVCSVEASPVKLRRRGIRDLLSPRRSNKPKATQVDVGSSMFTASVSMFEVETGPISDNGYNVDKVDRFAVDQRGEPLVNVPPLTCPFKLTEHDYFVEMGYMQSDCNSMAEAQSLALTCGRPMLAIETRIPGDSDAGMEVFSHPLIVEACRSFFTTYIRVVREDEDQAQKRRAERAPSGKPCRTKVLFLDPQTGMFLVDPLYGDLLTRADMLSSIVKVIGGWRVTASIPKYLSLIREEEMAKSVMSKSSHTPRPRDHTSFFATEDAALAEVSFAELDEVFATRAILINGKPSVEVSFNPWKLPFCSLVRHALKHNLATTVYYKTNDQRRAAAVEISRFVGIPARLLPFPGNVQPAGDSKKALRNTTLRFVPLTDIQSTRANRLVHLGRFNEAMHLLSPQQGAILMQAMQLGRQKIFHDVVDVPILIAWISISKQCNPFG